VKNTIKSLLYVVFLTAPHFLSAMRPEIKLPESESGTLESGVKPRDTMQDRWNLLNRLRNQDTSSTELGYIKKTGSSKKGRGTGTSVSKPPTVSSTGVIVGKGLQGETLTSQQIRAVAKIGRSDVDFAKPRALFLPNGEFVLNRTQGVTLRGEDADPFLKEIQGQMKAQRATYKKWYSRLTPKQKEQEQKSFEVINTELSRLAKLQENSSKNEQAILQVKQGIRDLIGQMNKETFDQVTKPVIKPIEKPAAKTFTPTEQEDAEKEMQRVSSAKTQQQHQDNTTTLPKNANLEPNAQITGVVLKVFGKDEKNWKEAQTVTEAVLLEDPVISSITAARAKNSDPRSLEYRVEAKQLLQRIQFVAKETKNIFLRVKQDSLETVTQEIETQLDSLLGIEPPHSSSNFTDEELADYDRLEIELAICKFLEKNESIVKSIQIPPTPQDILDEPQVLQTMKSVLGKSYKEFQETAYEVLGSDAEIEEVTQLRTHYPDPQFFEYKQASKRLVARVKLVTQEVKTVMTLVKKAGGNLAALARVKEQRGLDLFNGKVSEDRSNIDREVYTILEKELTRRSYALGESASLPEVPHKRTTFQDLLYEVQDDEDQAEAEKMRPQEALKKTLDSVIQLDNEISNPLPDTLSNDELIAELGHRQEKIQEFLVQTFGEDSEKWELDPSFEREVKSSYDVLMNTIAQHDAFTIRSVPERSTLELIEKQQGVVVAKVRGVLEAKLPASSEAPEFSGEKGKQGTSVMRVLDYLRRRKSTSSTASSSSQSTGKSWKEKIKDLLRRSKQTTPKVEETPLVRDGQEAQAGTMPVVHSTSVSDVAPHGEVEPTTVSGEASVTSSYFSPETRDPFSVKEVFSPTPTVDHHQPEQESEDGDLGDPKPLRSPFHEKEEVSEFAVQGGDGDSGAKGSLKKVTSVPGESYA
jgi:hypothetical protein